MKEKNNIVWLWIQRLIPVGCMVSFIMYLFYASALGKYDIKIMLGFLAACGCGIVQIFVKTGIFELLASVLMSVTMFYFITLTETVGSYADFFNNIVAFGHAELIGRINAVIIVTAIGTVLTIVGCFGSPQKEDITKKIN